MLVSHATGKEQPERQVKEPQNVGPQKSTMGDNVSGQRSSQRPVREEFKKWSLDLTTRQ